MITLYFFKLNGCGHCETMKSVLHGIKSIPNLSIQEVEHNDKNKLSPSIQRQLEVDNINAYPELKIINYKTNKVSKYNGERNAEDISKWILKNGSSDSKSNSKSKSKSKSKSRTTHNRGYGRHKHRSSRRKSRRQIRFRI